MRTICIIRCIAVDRSHREVKQASLDLYDDGVNNKGGHTGRGL